MMCEDPNDVSDMVQCDKCQLWAHYTCVGVTESIREQDWNCKNCALELQVPNTKKKTKRTGAAKAKSDGGSVHGEDDSLSASLRKLEQERRAMEKKLEEELILQEKRLIMEAELKAKRRQRELEIQEKVLAQERELKKRQLAEERKMMERHLAEERAYSEERRQLHEAFQRQRNLVAKEFTNQDTTVGESSKAEKEMSFDNKIQFWMNKQDPRTKKPLETVGVQKRLSGVPADEDYEETDDDDEEEVDSCEEEEEATEDSEEEREEVVKPKGRVLEHSRKKDRKNGNPQQPETLSSAQIAARQAISKHLPVFRGEPEVWPIFISSYEFTTKACGFSNLDNLKRLQDSLQGNALEAVRSRLVLPNSVPDVIEDLRRLFGKPEKLLKTLLSKVRNSTAPRADRLETFIQFGLTVKQLCDHLEAAKLKEHLSNPMLVQELVDKLPPDYKLDWVRFKRGKKGTPLRMFTNFMNDIVSDISEVSEFSSIELGESSSSSLFNKGKPRRKEFIHVHEAVHNQNEYHLGAIGEAKEMKPCWVCKRTDHKLRFCDDFKKLKVAERLKVVDQNKLCMLCLNNHGKSPCNFKVRCAIQGCQGGHHTLLHRAEAAVQHSKVECNAHSQRHRTVIFRMIPVTIHYGNRAFDTLAFFDEGSSSTLVEESVANFLGADGCVEPLVVTWTGNVKRYENTSRKVDLMLSARGSHETVPLLNAHTVGELKLPQQSLLGDEIADKYPHLQDVSVESYPWSEPGIIVGLDNLHSFAPLESRVGQPGEPIAVRTKLGWMVYGPERHIPAAEIRLNFHSHEPISNESLHDLLRIQYVLDDTNPSSIGSLESSEDQRARQILQSTTIRKGDRFETGLLWRDDVRRFPDSFPMAIRRLKALERKLDSNPELFRNVHQQVRDYVAKGYAHKATEEDLSESNRGKIWYLPLNVVLNPRKPGKVRLVWDAAATVNGISLNSELLSGPDLLQSLPAVINSFRERRIAFGADIQEMYHQIRIRSEDKSAQRFLFRSKPTDEPEVYVMDVATFGATCSPCSAQFIKNLNAAEYAEEFPEAAVAIVKNHYVDDYYDSADSIDEAVKIASDVKFVHSRGGFHIRNWVSNSPEFLQVMGGSSDNPNIHFNRDKSTLFERVLGIIWNPMEDVFCFSTTVREDYQPVLQGIERPTKRIVLSCVMSMFDPQGLLSPFTVFGRMLIQDLWRTGCDWDDALDNDSNEKWLRWTNALPLIAKIKIQRSYFGDAKFEEIENIQLHILTDASKGAFGCVAYFRAIIRGKVRCALVASRVKVAPLKPTSVPRLELQAAVLGARLASTVRQNHSFSISQQFFWTDSTTVLSWIRSDQRRYKEYVALRVGEILTLSRLSDWKWIPTKLNVADQLTKWTREPEFGSDAVWFKGPEFLHRGEEEWPKQRVQQTATMEELKAHLLVHSVTLPETVIDFYRISKWTVLVRTVATVYRFISNCKRKVSGLPIETLKPTIRQAQGLKHNDYPATRTPLKQSEFAKAERALFKIAQKDAFEAELKILLKNVGVSKDNWLQIEKSSTLYKLTPLVDDHGIIRLEGRSERAEFLPFDLRFPVILPKDHGITEKIVQHYHEKFGHSYRETVKNEIRQRFLIPKVGVIITKIARSCVWCKVNRNQPQTPRMAALPIQRLTPHLRPFSFVGVDYLGPVTVTVGRRCEKRWIVVFTCLVVRAIHLEVAHSLTTQSCLMAIRRFICRRGPPLEIFSDNGTNLKGASKELLANVRAIDEECANEVTSACTKWSFNPPATPHMGGVWERLVRSVKELLVVLDDGQKLNDEILSTSIAEAEDIINSRPLVYEPMESDEGMALTPNSFLRGVSSNELWRPQEVNHSAKALRDSYHRSQQLTEEIWKKWIREYIPSVNIRTKWFADSKNLKVGDLVYVVEGAKRKCWVRGLVEEVIVSSDGRVRQAWVRTNSGLCKRAAVNLAMLEVTDSDTEPELAPGTGSRVGAC